MGLTRLELVLTSLVLTAVLALNISLLAMAAEPPADAADSDTAIEIIEFDPNATTQAEQDNQIQEVKLTEADRVELAQAVEDDTTNIDPNKLSVDRKKNTKKWLKVAAVVLLVAGATALIIILCKGGKGGGKGGGGASGSGFGFDNFE